MNTRLNQSGQAVLEYILVLVITLMVVMGVVYQFNDAFREWGESYFGEYLACILETGELPALGGQETVGACDQEFATFSLADGRPYVGSGAGGGGGGAGGGGAGAGEGEAGQDGAAGRGGGRGQQTVMRGAGAGGGGAGGGFRPGQSPPRGAMGAGTGRGAGKGDRYTGDTSFMAVGATGVDGEAGQARRKQRQGMSYGWTTTREQKDDGQVRPVVAPKQKKDQDEARSERLKIERAPAQQVKLDDEEPLTFGGFLRFLLIAAIIIAILLFLGSQAMQIRNSLEGS